VLAIPAPRHDDEPFVESVGCATDFSAADLNAFAHALMMAVRCAAASSGGGKTAKRRF
jgi:hypothetical protein